MKIWQANVEVPIRFPQVAFGNLRLIQASFFNVCSDHFASSIGFSSCVLRHWAPRNKFNLHLILISFYSDK